MTKQVQFRRGTTAQHSVFTGALAEITVDTDKKTAIVHDASTVGGLPLVGSYGGSYTFTTNLDLIGAASRSISLRGGNAASASLTIDASNNAQFFNDLTIGNADTDNVTFNSQFVNGTKLKTAKSSGNTLAVSAYDVDGASYTDLITLTAGNTPTIAITSTGVGSINNIDIGATTRGTGSFTTLNANGNVTLGDASADAVTVNGTTTFNAPVSFSGGTSHLTLTGELRGPSTFIIDPAAVGDDTGTVSIKGNLEVLGTTTTINSTVTTIADPVIELRRGNSITAADGGVQVNLTTNGSGVVQTFQRLQWNNSSSLWETTDGTTAKPIVNTVDAQTIAGNKTFSNNLTASGSNAAIQFSPTGTGSVTINPATSGSIDRMNIGANTRGTGAFTTLDANSTVGLSPANASVTISPSGTGSLTINPNTAGTINNMSIGATTRGTGAFTTLDANGNVSSTSYGLQLTGSLAAVGSEQNRGLLKVGTLEFNDSNLYANFQSSVNSYSQVVIQNTNSGGTASSDFVVHADGASSTTRFGDFGINSTGFTGGGAWGDAGGTYLYSKDGTLSLGTNDAFALKLFANSNTNTVAGITVNTNNTINIGGSGTAGGTASIGSTITTGIVNLFTGVTGTINIGTSGTIVSVPAPVTGSSVANKTYVDAMAIAFGC